MRWQGGSPWQPNDYPNLELQSYGRWPCWLWHFGQRHQTASSKYREVIFCRHRVNKKLTAFSARYWRNLEYHKVRKAYRPKLSAAQVVECKPSSVGITSNTPAKFYTIIPLLWLWWHCILLLMRFIADHYSRCTWLRTIMMIQSTRVMADSQTDCGSSSMIM